MSLSLSGMAQAPCEEAEVLNIDAGEGEESPDVAGADKHDPNLGKIAALRDTIPIILIGDETTFLLWK